MPRDPRTYVWDALRAADLIDGFTQARTLEEYEGDAMLRSAVERQLEIIGAALATVDDVPALRTVLRRLLPADDR